ncbi:MAG: Ig-like domain-containing protein [Candidatus Bipolaricaulia bacterium]
MRQRSVGQRWFFVSLVLLSTVLGGAFLNADEGADTGNPVAVAPRILTSRPSEGGELATDGVVEFLFNVAMERASVEAAFTMEPAISGSLEWLDDQTVRFVPESGWPRATSFSVLVSTGAQSLDGLHLQDPFSLGFRTVGHLTVTQVIPADGTVAVEDDSEILVTFNRPVVPLTAISDPALAELPQPLQFSPEIEGTGEWLNTSTYSFTPSERLSGGTSYTAFVQAGLSGIGGASLAEDFVWDFTTVRPEVVWHHPSREAKMIPVDTSIRITFNLPISPIGAAERLTVRTASLFGELLAHRVPGTLSIEEDVLTFTPSEPLAFDRQYVVTLDPGITGEAGGMGTSASTSWRFRTVPLPQILGTNPKDGEDDAYSYTSFEIRFNAPIDPDTVMGNVSIDPEPDPEDLDTWYRSRDHTFVIRFGAEPSREYTFRIGPEIADPYGNKTGQRRTVTFRTAPLSPVAWLHVPGQTSTLNSSEAARLVVGYRNTDRLNLKLWRIDLADYFDAMSDWHDFSPSSPPDRSWSVPVSAPLNEPAYAAVDLADGGGPLEPGIYVVDLRADEVEWTRWNHRHLLISSPINVTLKSTESEALAWATDLEIGTPVPGLILRAYDRDGEQLDVSVTDSDGLAILSAGDGADWRGLTIVGNDPFVLVGTDWNDGISTWSLGLYSETPPDGRAFLDTDRPIYRPGQSVFFRGVIRDESDVVYTLPDLASIDVTIRNPLWEEIYAESLTLDEFGGFSGTIELAEDTALGDYAIRAVAADRTFYHEFQVAAYRAPEFEVTVVSDRDEVGKGEPIRAVVSASYFFGAPVTDVPVEWRILSQTYRFAPSAFGRYSFDNVHDPWVCWSCWWIPESPPTPILNGYGRSDADGNLLIKLPLDIAELSAGSDPATGSRLLTIEATAYGPNGDTISGRTTVVVHEGSFYVGLATGRSIGRAGDETSVDVVTVDWEGGRVGGRPLRYAVVRREWLNVFEEDETGGGRWTWTTQETEIADGSLVTDENGDGRVMFVPPEGGSYKILVEGEDEAGRTVRSSLFLWASGPESVSWRRTNDDLVTLISDRTSYAVGETAEILIPSPYLGEQWALVTVERGGILSRDVVLLPSNSSTILIPIEFDHIPNVYVSVVLVQGRQAAVAAASGAAATASTKVGYLALSVDPAPKELKIELAPSSMRLEPGDPVTIDLRVTDASGLPTQAALSLDLVDKAILSLQPRSPDRILSTFYGRRGLGVRTASGLVISLTRLALEQLEDLDLPTDDKFAGEGEGIAGAEYMLPEEPAPAGALREAEEANAEAQLPEGVEVREDFLDTAYWHPNVITDEDGFARVVVDLPDNLTTWIVRSVGATRETLVGEETTEILVTKPLLVRPATPRFLVVGDRVRLAASVSNQTDEDRVVDVTVGATGVSLEDPALQTINVPAGSEIMVTWWATVLDAPVADLAFSAVSGDLSDAARPRLTLGPDGTLPIFRYTARETVGTAGQLMEEGSRIEEIAVPASFDPTSSELAVRLEPSLAAAMSEGLSYLEHFEYECTEQLVSRFLPNALSYRALMLLEIEDAELKGKLDVLVSYGLSELVERQNGDGGWGWWKGERSNPHLTAYATFALLRLREIGFEIDGRVLERGLDYMAAELVPTREFESVWDANRQAWLVYVLSLGRPSVASEYVESLVEDREKLSHYAKAYVALALLELGDDSGSLDTLVSDLFNAAILSATGAHWEEDGVDWWAMNTDTRSTAIILDALVRIDPANTLLPNVVRWLMVARRAGIWETTQETAWALIALTDWMVATGELRGTYELSVGLNDEAILIDSVTPETVREPLEITIAGIELAESDVHHLSIARGPGEGSLYYTAHLIVGLPVEEVEPLDRGIYVYRQYVSLDAGEDEAAEERTAAGVGETIQVRLTIVAPNDLYYVVVEDPIPAGCEAVDPSLATTSLLEPEPGISRDDEDWTWWGGWWRWYSRSEFRDEKVVLFTDFLSAGSYSFTYTLRGVTPGAFRVLPTSAYEFYFPEVFGRSDGRIFRVTE